MIDQTKFEFIKKKYGHYASWAIWANEEKRPKDNMGVSIFDNIESNPDLLNQLKPDIILVGLNISRGAIKVPLSNFHPSYPEAQDYKTRFALKGSPFWGAYMTDIIKDFDQKDSGKLMSYLRNNKPFEEKNIEIFREEIKNLGVDKPTIVAFGVATYKILDRNFKNEFKIFKIPHYSHYISKEKYREQVKSILGFE